MIKKIKKKDSAIPEPVKSKNTTPAIDNTGPKKSSALTTYDPLQHYLTEIRQYPFLSKEEEINLTKQYYKTKDPNTALSLIHANLRFVVKIAKEYQSTAIPLLDLIQEGNIGLMRAIKKFDPYKEVRVVTYASWWIRAAILKYILNNWRLVKLGTTQNERKLFFQLKKERAKLEAQGIEDIMPVLQKKLQVKESEIVDMQHRLDYRETSLDAPLGDNSEGETTGSMLSSERPTSEEELQQIQLSKLFREKLKKYEKTLNPRDLTILKQRILSNNPKTFSTLSKEFSISIERVRQLEQKVIKNFKKYITKEIKGFDTLFKDISILNESDII